MLLPHQQAKDYLSNWYGRELRYLRDFQMWKAGRIPNSDYQENFRGVLNYFLVFRWVGIKRLPKLMTCTLEWVHGNDPDNVDEFARVLLTDFDGKIMTSMASKILFLNHPQKISPIDTQVRGAFDLETNIYRDYYPLLTRFRQQHIEEIQRNLATISPALVALENESKNDIQDLETVRINRYTDQLLREIGKARLKDKSSR